MKHLYIHYSTIWAIYAGSPKPCNSLLGQPTATPGHKVARNRQGRSSSPLYCRSLLHKPYHPPSLFVPKTHGVEFKGHFKTCLSFGKEESSSDTHVAPAVDLVPHPERDELANFSVQGRGEVVVEDRWGSRVCEDVCISLHFFSYRESPMTLHLRECKRAIV